MTPTAPASANLGMTPFAKQLHAIVTAPKALTDLQAYLSIAPGTTYTGRAFETYGAARFDHFRITGDDLVAVAMLSMEIKLGTRSGISPDAAICLDRRSDEISSLLAQIPVHVQLHQLQTGEADDLLLDEESPGSQLWHVILDTLSNAGQAPATTNKWVATYKLLARKRPHLFPVRDSKSVTALGSGNVWWSAWWGALHNNPPIVQALIALRHSADAGHLSLLRVADIVTWMS
jgi:hypothetical protein